MSKSKNWFIPVTPGGTVVFELKAENEKKAWNKLLKDAAHMPYKGVQGFKDRGYKVELFKLGD